MESDGVSKRYEWALRHEEMDIAYMKWHHDKCGRHMSAIDIDSVEYCKICGELLALIEVAWDIGQSEKSTTVTRKLAQLANLPAYLVFYEKNSNNSIVSFRISQLCPERTEERVMTPFEYQMFLCSLRYRHKCYVKNQSYLEDMMRNLVHFTFGMDGQKADYYVQAAISFVETCYPR
jgi:hypothetical protein